MDPYAFGLAPLAAAFGLGVAYTLLGQMTLLAIAELYPNALDRLMDNSMGLALLGCVLWPIAAPAALAAHRLAAWRRRRAR